MTYNGKLYYVFPTATKDKIYVGRQKQFNAYKQALAAQYASHPASQQGSARSTADGRTVSDAHIRNRGPQHIEVQQFGGFGPMGTPHGRLVGRAI